jgi:hypothetical protein
MASAFWSNIAIRIDAFVIGSMKCATKWLAQSLRNSGRVIIPGECQGLTQLADHDGSFYNSFFSAQAQAPELCTIDYSNSYMLDASLPEKIKTKFGAVPIILCFRNPVERAFSHYLMDVTYEIYEFEPESGFREALLSPRTYSYFDCGLYRKNLIPFLDVFGSQLVMVVDVDTIGKNPQGAVRRMLDFLRANDAAAALVLERVNSWEQFRANLGQKVRRSASQFFRAVTGLALELLSRRARDVLRILSACKCRKVLSYQHDQTSA